MSSRFASPAIVFALALVALGAEAAWADRGPRNQAMNAQNIQKVQGNNGLPASVRRIERETGGEVLKAQPIQRDGREVYRVKVLTPQGRIRVVEDAPRDHEAPEHAPPRDHPTEE
jgi:hypothetical protein